MRWLERGKKQMEFKFEELCIRMTEDLIFIHVLVVIPLSGLNILFTIKRPLLLDYVFQP